MLKKSSVEMWVGVFVFIGILCVSYLTIRLGKLDWFGSDTYKLVARFESVSGLKSGAFVEMAGVQIGEVGSISLDQEEYTAIVEIVIKKEITLSDDVIASVKTSGLIGDKYLKLSSGGSDSILKDGEIITETESAVDIEDLISKYVFGGIK
ncbi:phospholipid/cholesterol/gamma-HCH transport system substrate-binding protein [Candidatus Magnetomoraceae bacterium gMMP-15]